MEQGIQCPKFYYSSVKIPSCRLGKQEFLLLKGRRKKAVKYGRRLEYSRLQNIGTEVGSCIRPTKAVGHGLGMPNIEVKLIFNLKNRLEGAGPVTTDGNAVAVDETSKTKIPSDHFSRVHKVDAGFYGVRSSI